MIIGAGPNGLSAAITLAKSGYRVKVIEGRDRPGGGCRTSELTLPGFRHDVCSAIHPLGISSTFFRALPLASYGLKWIHPPIQLAHPLDDGTAIAIYRSVESSASSLGEDSQRYRTVMGWLVRHYRKFFDDYLGPLRFPSHPFHFAMFGAAALMPSHLFARGLFRGVRARALFGGLAAHSILPLTRAGTTAFGLMLGMLTHAVGWPMAAGGSQNIISAMTAYLETLGGEIETNRFITHVDEALQEGRIVLFNTAPDQVASAASAHLPEQYLKKLSNYRYGPGVFKLDFALDKPVPWKAPECRQAGTVHLGGTLEEIVASEAAIWRGEHPDRPFVLVGQLSPFDSTRAPEGKHTLWTYCHVPNGSTADMSEQIESQIERFAPGFRDTILAKHKMTAVDMSEYNHNYVGGDINAGIQDLSQLFTRPVARLDPYSTPSPRIFICSSSTPPGGGVHGMCGYYAAQSAIQNALKRD